MITSNRPRLRLLAIFVLAADAAHADLAADDLARLAAHEREPQALGELVCTGQVHALGSPGAPPLFRYQRRVLPQAGGLLASHITADPGGQVLIVEQAQVDSGYGLQHFETVNRQSGQRGSVQVADGGRRLDYRLQDPGGTRSASEAVNDPVVSGPSLHGFIHTRWAALVQGQVLRVRFVVPALMRSYAFDIALADAGDGLTTFSVTPARWWVRLALAPLSVRFDTGTRQLVRYEGRVPPTVLHGGRRRALDARVDYTMAVPAYR